MASKSQERIEASAPARETTAGGPGAPEREATPSGLRALQRGLGNQALGRLLSGSPRDPLEEEANAVAGRVAGSPAPGAAPLSSSGGEGGTPLPTPLRSALEPRLGASFAATRLHTGEAAARAASSLGTAAFTVGRDIVFGRGRFDPGSRRGLHLLAHELAHVVQQGAAPRREGESSSTGDVRGRAPVQPQGYCPPDCPECCASTTEPPTPATETGDDAGAPVCRVEPPVTMPEPAVCDVPAEVPTSITIRPPALPGDTPPATPAEERIELGVPVQSAEPITLYAVPVREVFASEAEAQMPVCRDEPQGSLAVPPVTTFGGIAWTAHGPIDVVYVTPDFVITTHYVKFATGAAAMTLVTTSEGLMLVDAGVQIGSPNGAPGNPRADLSTAAVQELVRHVGGRRIVKVLVTHQHSDHINLLPRIAEHVEIGTIQITARQAQGDVFRRVLDAVEQAQARYRTVNLPARIEAEMAPERDAWLRERTFTDRLSPERAEAAWRDHVEARIRAAQAQVRFPTVELLIGGPGGQPLLIEAELHRSPGEIEARVPAGAQRGGTITQPLRQGSVTTFTQPDADAPARFHPDTHSANYILNLPDGTQLVVIADPRDRDLVAVRENFERALRAAGHEARFRIVEGTHHMQRGMLTREESGPRRGHLVSNQFLVDAAAMLAEIAAQRGPTGRPARSAVVVGGAESRISPANVWLVRSLGYEAYVTTDARTVEMLSILDSAGERLTGLTGDPRGGGRPSQALVMRAGLEIASLRQRIQALDTRIGESNNPDDVQARADLQSRLADTRRLLHEYMNAFNQEIGRGSRDPSRPAVAPAQGVEPAAAERQALTDHLDRVGAAAATPERLTPLSEPVLVLIDRTQGVPLTPQQQRIRQHIQEIERLRGELETGTPAAGRRVQLLGEMEGLRQLLRTEAQGLGGEEADFVRREIARLDTSITSLERALDVRTVTTPDPASGGRSRTRILAEQPINPEWSLRRQQLERGFGVAGRVFGSVMIVHTVAAQSQLADRIQSGDATALEALAGSVHNVHGFTVGVRMARLMPVHFGEFAVLAILDFTATAAADYDSRDEARTAIAYSAFSNALNLALFAIGGILMRSPNPWTASLGFGVMLLGEPILRVTGAAAAFERWMSFEPSEVTGVEQELRDLMQQYRIVVGALELSRRDLESLSQQGAGDPEAVRRAALIAIDQHRQEARELEPDILSAFESGYNRARESYSGLSGLDTLREAFADLHAHVWRGTERGPGTAEYDRLVGRFQSIETSLDLSGASAEQIREMEQWSEIDRRLNQLHTPLFDLRADDIDWPEVLEDLREVERMFQNARYRLAPVAQGSHRLTPLLAEGSAARGIYETELRAREERYSRFLTRLSSLGGGRALPVQPWQPAPPGRLATAQAHEEQLEPGAPSPGLGLTPEGNPYRIEIPAVRDVADAASRVRSLRGTYEANLQDLASAFDRSTLDQLWGASADVERRYQELLRTSGREADFFRLQARELALSGAVSQARSLAVLDRGAGEEALRSLGEELRLAERAIDARKTEHGLLFPNEIEGARAEIRQAEEQQVALALGGVLERQIGPLEGEALRSDELEEAGRQVSSARSQLARLAQEQAAAGESRLRLYRMGSSGSPLVDPVTGVFAPIVGTTGRRHEVVTMAGHRQMETVIPINAEAVRILGGTGPHSVYDSELWPVSVQELVAARRGERPPEGGQP